jgi:hypothetical protein
MTPRISYLLPVHNDAATIVATARTLATRLRAFPGSEIVLVENGSADASYAQCMHAAERSTAEVSVIVSRSAPGMGNALREGIRVSRGDLVILTASDLPFGFTDLDAWLKLDSPPKVVIGSKGHPQSEIETSLLRRTLSAGFTAIRRLALGVTAADTQGAIFIDGDLCRSILPHLRCEDYLITTEVVAWAQRFGHAAFEVPVKYRQSGESTVSPVRDAARMLVGLMRLRQRLRLAPADAYQ